MEIKSLPVQNEDGDLVPGSSATVYHMDSGDVATIYDRDGEIISNPITAGDDGIIEFAAENGPYRVILTIGIQQYERFLYFSDIKEHNHSPSAHPELSAFITSEADRAEQAADAAALNSGVYPDTAAGLSATTEGDYFSVPSAEDDEYLILYLHDAGPVATEIKRYPSAEAVEVLSGEYTAALSLPQDTSTYTGSQYAIGSSWLVGTGQDIEPNVMLSSHTLEFRMAAGGTTVGYKLWQRPQAGNTTAAPGSGTAEVLLLDMTFPVADFPGLVAGGAQVQITIPYGDLINTAAGTSLSYEIYATDGAARVAVGAGQSVAGAATIIAQRVWHKSDETTWVQGTSTRRPSGVIYKHDTYVALDPAFIGLADRVAITESGIEALGIEVSQVKAVTDQITQSEHIGRTEEPITGSNSASRTYIFADPIEHDGTLKTVTVYSKTGGEIKIRRWSKNGDVFSRVGDDMVFTLVAGVNTLSPAVAVSAGELLGYYSPPGGVTTFVAGTADGSGWYSGDGDLIEVTDSSATLAAQLQIGFEIEYIALSGGDSTSPVATDLLSSMSAEFTIGGFTVGINGKQLKNGLTLPFNTSVEITEPAAGGERIDYICVNRATQAVSVVEGVERVETDHDAIEYPPTPTSQSQIVAALSVRDTGISLANAAEFRGLIKVGREGEFAAHVARNQLLIRRSMGKIMRGESINVGATGDSITALMVHDVTYPVGYAANGRSRDRPDLYFTYYPLDTYSGIDLYDFGDGGGQVHCKVGHMWHVMRAMDERAGAPITTYYNYGIGSTNSSATEDNGLYPARIAEPLGDPLDVIFIMFGMNERGSTSTYGNLVNMIGQHQNAGQEVVIVGCPRPNESYGLAGWRYTCDAAESAAMDAGAAFVSTAMLADERNLGAMRVPSRCLGSANIGVAGNHPGIYELRMLGESCIAQLGL